MVLWLWQFADNLEKQDSRPAGAGKDQYQIDGREPDRPWAAEKQPCDAFQNDRASRGPKSMRRRPSSANLRRDIPGSHRRQQFGRHDKPTNRDALPKLLQNRIRREPLQIHPHHSRNADQHRHHQRAPRPNRRALQNGRSRQRSRVAKFNPPQNSR